MGMDQMYLWVAWAFIKKILPGPSAGAPKPWTKQFRDRDQKTMIARDVTEMSHISPGVRAMSLLTNVHREVGEKEAYPLEKIQFRWRPEVADFCPLPSHLSVGPNSK